MTVGDSLCKKKKTRRQRNPNYGLFFQLLHFARVNLTREEEGSFWSGTIEATPFSTIAAMCVQRKGGEIAGAWQKYTGDTALRKGFSTPYFPRGRTVLKKCLFHFFVTGALKGDRTESGFILTQKFNPFPSPVDPPSPYLEGCSEGWEPRVFLSLPLFRGRDPPLRPFFAFQMVF